jgi:glycosyltransferase involved in cell wall biosynthesis
MHIKQVLDPSHADWVLGGIFRDLRAQSDIFETKPAYLSSFPGIKKIFPWVGSFLALFKERKLLFSSITPLENYFKFSRFLFRKQQIGLWFTHQEGSFTSIQEKALRSCDVIFVHSNREKERLSGIVSCRIVVVIGAIEPIRFAKNPRKGKCVLWIGTPNERKNPGELIRFTLGNPELDFRILGKGWKGTAAFDSIKGLPNVEYVEILGPLNSSDLDGCDIYLCTSLIEGGPMPLLEATAGNLKVISRDVGFVRDVFLRVGISEQFIYSRYEEIRPLIEKHRADGAFPQYAEKVKEYSFLRLAETVVTGFDQFLG